MNTLELINGLSVEEMTAKFFDEAIIVAPYKVFQLNSNGFRYYYKFDDDGEPTFYPSVTTILSQVMPKSPYLEKWINEMGAENAERYKMERASYGTFMHSQFEKLLIEGEYNLDTLQEQLAEYIDENSLPKDFIYYCDDLKKDLLAFAQFIIDYDVKPIAIEIGLVHPEKKYAGCVDLVCSMRESPKSEERIRCIIDFKSGRKGFHEEHELQLEMYRQMWNYNYPDHAIERIFNFSPKDWRKLPTYNLKEQTDSENLAKLPHLLALAEIEDSKRKNVFVHCSGTIKLSDGVADNVTSISLSEIVKATAEVATIPGDDIDALAALMQESKSEPTEETKPEPKPIKEKAEPKKTTKAPAKKDTKKTATKATAKKTPSKPVSAKKPTTAKVEKEKAVTPKSKKNNLLDEEGF